MAQEKRKRSRIGIKVPVVIRQQEKRVVTLTRDISLKGLLAGERTELETDQPCSLSIRLNSGISINIDGLVVSNSSRGSAVDFVRMDEDSFHHLYNLVRLYSGDPDSLDRELLTPAFDRSLLDKYLGKTEQDINDKGE